MAISDGLEDIFFPYCTKKELNTSQDQCHWSLVQFRFARMFVSPYSLVKTHVGLKLLEIFGNSILPQSHPTVTGSIPVCKNVCFPQINKPPKMIMAILDRPSKLSWSEHGSNKPKVVSFILIEGSTPNYLAIAQLVESVVGLLAPSQRYSMIEEEEAC